MAGFYLMHRGWQDNPVFGGPKREPFCRRSAWAWLIERAVFAATSVSIGGDLVELRRGQLSYSLRNLASEWGWSTTKVFRYCSALVSAKMIFCSSETGQIIITICNYDKYQIESRSGETLSGVTVEHRRNTGGTHNKEGKEGKEGSVGSNEPTAAEAAPSPPLVVVAGTEHKPVPDPKRELYALGKQVLGKSSGGQITKLIAKHGGDLAAAKYTMEQVAAAAYPAEYLGKILDGERNTPTDFDAELRAMGVNPDGTPMGGDGWVSPYDRPADDGGFFAARAGR